MNIYLIPYNLSRHIVVALYVGSASLFAWWVTLAAILKLGPIAWDMGLWWSQGTEGVVLVANISGVVATASVFVEGSLRRRKIQYLVFYAGLAGAIAWGITAGFALLYLPMKPLLGSGATKELLRDPSLVSLRYRLLLWLAAGVASGIGPWFSRRNQAVIARRLGWGVDGVAVPKAPTWGAWALDVFHHVAGGATAALLAAGVWHVFGHYDRIAGDLYLATAMGSLAFGLAHGLLVWGIPDDLYAGWLRVLSAERYGLRIPVPRPAGGPAERFVGHFPRGLDLYLPGEQGVAELHLSVVVDDDHRYAARGLSIRPTVVRRFLERIDLRYDPRRPAPLETELSMEDRIQLGENAETELEFLLLPKEER